MTLRAALTYAARGWRVLPLVPGGKEPCASLVRHGAHQASDDPQVLRYWWARQPSANVGVRCDSLLVVDLDARHDGLERWAEITRGRTLPRTPKQVTATGGVHLLFRRPDFTCVGKLELGVDVITGVRYFVAAPSVRAAGRYRWEIAPRDQQVAEAPAWLLALVRRREPRVSEPAHHVLSSERVQRARRYVAAIPPAVSGQGGHDHTFATCVRVARGFALNESEAFAVLADWNRTCQPPWSARDLARKVKEALRVGDMPLGALLERGRNAA